MREACHPNRLEIGMGQVDAMAADVCEVTGRVNSTPSDSTASDKACMILLLRVMTSAMIGVANQYAE